MHILDKMSKFNMHAGIRADAVTEEF